MHIDYLTIDTYVQAIYTGSQVADVKLYRDIIRNQNKQLSVYACDHPFFSK